MSSATDAARGELYCTSCERTFETGEKCPFDGTRLMKLKHRIDPFLGRDLDGRYTVLEKLGQGGMGAVYRAEQHSIDREVAIKVVNSNLVCEPEVIKRFLREAKLASRLSHPNAVGVLDFGQTDDGVFYLVMELVHGRTLDTVIKMERYLPPERVVRIASQVCDALEGAHAMSIIHRDLKPSNIMLLATGRDLVKVLDFGLAKSVSPDSTATTMTNAGSVVGTPAFMPPELARGEACDARSDLYSLGAILYLMTSGRLPFHSDSVHELIAKHGSDEEAPPVTGVPRELGRVIERLLRKDARLRYQTAAAARLALEEALADRRPSEHDAGDTRPSIGPFPGLGPTLDGSTRLPAARGSAAVTRSLFDADTALPAEAEAVLAAARAEEPSTSASTSMPAPVAASDSVAISVQVPARRRARWPLIAGAGAVVAVLAVALGLGLGSGVATAPPSPPAPAHAPVASTPPPAVATPPVATPPVATPPVATPPVTAPPVATPAVTTPPRGDTTLAHPPRPTTRKPTTRKPTTGKPTPATPPPTTSQGSAGPAPLPF